MAAVFESLYAAGSGAGRWPEVACRVGLRVVPWLLAAGIAAQPAARHSPADAAVFKVFVSKPGVYRLTYEDLRQAGLEVDAVDSRNLALTRHGRDVPIWVADGGDGRFGPGDRIELVGERLAGHRSFYNEYTSINVYRLRLDRDQGLRMTAPPPPPAAAARPAEPVPLEVEVHAETDLFLLRFGAPEPGAPEPGAPEPSADEPGDPEPWYWQRLTHIDPAPFRHGFWLHRVDPDPRRSLSLKVHLQGWSTAGGTLADHRVEVYLNGRRVGAGEWDGEEARLIEMTLPADVARPGKNVVELRVPRRRPEGLPEADPVIDEVILNWLEIRYPRRRRIDSRPVRLVVSDPGPEAWVELATAPGVPLTVYGTDGSRFDRRHMAIEESAGVTIHAFRPPPQASELHVVPAGELRAPLAVELVRPSRLRDPSRQADYVIITHPRLRRAIEPLAAFHRRRGLEVTVVPVEEIYDQFNHSILDPRAIRDFLSYAYRRWRRPAPRFVLLAGDASWAGRAGGSSYGLSTPLLGKAQARRNLIPAGIYQGRDGPAASDNFYVAVDGDDLLPDLAIGRLPVTEPEEVAAIVDKTLSYASGAGVGPWRRNILWITSDNPAFPRLSDDVADTLADRGFAALKVYPLPEDTDNRRHQEILRQAFARGQLLVHFLGHGGRYIWRTGPTSFRDKGDLFSLAHLDQLAPAVNLPLVLSMSCHSAPFDHPTADSIGEKFLRLEDRGAIAVLAASWRVTPFVKFSKALVEELTSQPTIGEAIVRAKHRIRSPDMVAKYNLLGDPAIELAVPEHRLKLVARAGGENAWEIAAPVPEEVRAGRAVVDWLDDAGEVVRSEPVEVNGTTLEAAFRRAGEEGSVASVRVYVWDEDAGVDGMGALDLRPDPLLTQ